MTRAYAEQVMRDHCSITWVVKGETFRDTIDEERITLRAEQDQKVYITAPLAPEELPGLRFAKPLSTKYRAPREVYIQTSEPVCVNRCQWPNRHFPAAA